MPLKLKAFSRRDTNGPVTGKICVNELRVLSSKFLLLIAGKAEKNYWHFHNVTFRVNKIIGELATA